MKKLYYAASLLTLVSLSILTGCKKDTTPFPTNPQSNGVYPDLVYTTPWFPTISDADGIFVSAQVTDQKTIIISPFKNEYEYGMVKLASSTGNFSTLSDGGVITLNDTVLTKSNDFSYLSSILNYTLNLSNSINWAAPSIGVTYSLSGASNPSYTYDPANWDSQWFPITGYIDYTNETNPKRAKDSLFDYKAQYSIPIKQFVSNADSVYITMLDNKGFFYRKVNLPTDSVSNFTPADFYKYFNTINIPAYDKSTFRLQIDAIKFNNTTIATKKYYFLKMASSIKYYQATK